MSEANINYTTPEQQAEEQDSSFNLRAILELTWSLRYWIILSVFVALLLAGFYLYIKPKLYTSDMMVMVTTDKNAGMGSSAQMSFLQDMTGVQSYNSLTNEKVIIKSTPVLLQVVQEHDLNIRYYVKQRRWHRKSR